MKRYIKHLVLGLTAFIALYFIAVLVLGNLSINNNFKQTPTGVEVYIKSNGAHTDLIVPMHNADYNWKYFISPSQTIHQDTSMQFVSFGWGDKGFFLETPSWSELKFSVAFKALFLPSPTAMHVSYCKEKPKLTKLCKSVKISHQQYLTLINYIQQSFKMSKHNQPLLISGAHYHFNDAFYEANGNYHLFKTCNEWTRIGLSVAGIKCACWSVFDNSVLKFID